MLQNATARVQMGTSSRVMCCFVSELLTPLSVRFSPIVVAMKNGDRRSCSNAIFPPVAANDVDPRNAFSMEPNQRCKIGPIQPPPTAPYFNALT